MKSLDNYIADGEYGKRGYLKENYRVFNIKDSRGGDFAFHYHEFDKIVLFIAGSVTYIVEGREYVLKPYDILLVRHGDIHKPIIDSSTEYERIVIWLDNGFLKTNHALDSCFDVAVGSSRLLRLSGEKRAKIFSVAREFIGDGESEFANDLMRDTLLLQLLILINRAVTDESEAVDFVSDSRIDSVIDYINANLLSELSVEKIAKEFFISRYYLMHRFKELTGKTVLSYIQSKRLLRAAALLGKGCSAKEACYKSGYRDYSVFLKAFKKEFDITPTEYKRQ
ncbi:MAG: helix-turn-helix domain-containing protein [Eubacterium sp.]|nr:helix-turn-helix domain-containing protein [Eubacterium sp.]